ncbi:MAG: hypothetical protein B6D40_00350, partial [Anaerolineae bacterium UTCFX3]
DNASNENGYVIYASTDGVNFTTQAGLTPGWQANAIPGTGSTGTTTVTGLSNVEQLYWRVYAVSEGRLSAAPAAIHPPSALTFTNFQPTSATLNWADSPDDAGYIILNSTNGADFAFVAQVPANAISYNAGGLTAGVSYAWRVQAINPRAASSAIQGSTPAVVITAPADNSTFLQSNTIHFDATATDALQGDLTPVIEWSSDIDGALGTGGSLNRSNMSLGQHVITAEATSPNGLTAVATITITVTDAGGNVPPQLFITAPVNNSVFMQGANVTFTGTANDLQDGNLSANIQWSSSIDGALGTGSSVSTNALSVGIHIITAQVTDSDNLTSTKTIRVYVTDLNGNLPPDLVILSPVCGIPGQGAHRLQRRHQRPHPMDVEPGRRAGCRLIQLRLVRAERGRAHHHRLGDGRQLRPDRYGRDRDHRPAACSGGRRSARHVQRLGGYLRGLSCAPLRRELGTARAVPRFALPEQRLLPELSLLRRAGVLHPLEHGRYSRARTAV